MIGLVHGRTVCCHCGAQTRGRDLSSSDRNIKGLLVREKTMQDKTRQDKTRQDKTSQDKTRQDKTRQGKTSQDNRKWKAMWLNALSSAPQSEKSLFSCGLVGWLVGWCQKKMKSKSSLGSIRSGSKMQKKRRSRKQDATDCNVQRIATSSQVKSTDCNRLAHLDLCGRGCDGFLA